MTKIIRRMYIQKQLISKFNETLQVYEVHQKQLAKLDTKIAKLQKRFDVPKQNPIERIVESVVPAPMAPPLKLAAVDLSLDNFKDPNEFLPKHGPAKKSQDTPRPFKTTGSYGALLPKILKMDKQSHIVRKKTMMTKMSSKKLFCATNKTKDDSVSKTQPLVVEMSEQVPVSSDPEPSALVLEENETAKRPTFEQKRAESVDLLPKIDTTSSPRKCKKRVMIVFSSIFR
jgi:hypothetical protein